MKNNSTATTRTVLEFFVVTVVVLSPLAGAFGQALTASRWGGSCSPSSGFELTLLAGSSFTVNFNIPHDRSLEDLDEGWPEGFTLEAALDWTRDQVFASDPLLIERFNPIPYLSRLNREELRVLEQRAEHADQEAINLRYFAFQIPDDLVGHTISFRATYSAGNQNSTFGPTQQIRMIAPCDRSDTARIIGSRVYVAHDSYDLQRGIELADSMLACGLTDAAAWHYAKRCAEGLGDFDKAITYLDQLFQDYGVTSVMVNGINAPQLNRDGQRDPQVIRNYERLRRSILQAKVAEEQQER